MRHRTNVSLAQRTARRDYARAYMRRYRAGRTLREFRLPPRPPFADRPGHCENCGHCWPTGGRCPLCAVESRIGRRSEPRLSVRRWIAWALLMEALA